MRVPPGPHDLSDQGGGRLILKPALRRGRCPDDDALYLAHGKGLAQYVFGQDHRPYLQEVDQREFGVTEILIERIERWVGCWNDVAADLPEGRSPLYCREFDIQGYNREALAICQAILPLLHSGQQLCYNGGKRKGAYHASWLREWSKPREKAAVPAYNAEDRDPARWVRVMGDFGSTGLWHWSGYLMQPTFLPISRGLKLRIAEWAAGHFSAINSWHTGQADDFARIQSDDLALRDYSDQGIAIARAVKAELPEWTVVYFDEDLSGRHVDRAVYQFEVF